VAAISTGNKPYIIIEESASHQIRRFADFNPNDLFWHRDKEDRTVILIEGESVAIQLDNKLPIHLDVGDEYFIPKMAYHRVVASSPFTVKILF
jgi:hypothetical protein